MTKTRYEDDLMYAHVAPLVVFVLVLLLISLAMQGDAPTCPNCGVTGLSAEAQAVDDELVWRARK